MWKVLLLFACVASCVLVTRCGDDAGETPPTGETKPTDETKPTGETEPTGKTAPTHANDDQTRSYGCGGHQPRCGKNEVYNNCSVTACAPQRCSELGFPLKCDMKCKPGCVCKDNYVRNDAGTCIPILNCPSCGGDKNAQRGCSNYCGHSCSDYNKPPGGCPFFCMDNGCDCRPGFVYDYNVKACVKPKDCTPICKANEQYASCTNGGCDARNCSQIGKPVPCVKLAPESCIKGCVCVAGYLRADNGTCVPKDQCQRHQPRCGKNEVYNNCSVTACAPQRCSELGFPLKCDMKCKPGCVCKDNYVRNDDGTCIPILSCPSCGGDKNAQHGCSNYCGHSCSDYNKPPRPCPRFCMDNGCNCRPGFVYDNNLKACVKPKDCTPICKANEQYSSCVNGGCDARNCSQVGKPVPCVKLAPESCIKGCVCVAGYLRADNGTCVPKDQCPTHQARCGKNEVYNNCSVNACAPRRCSELGFPLKCDMKCKPGCVCKDNYVRNDDGTCIPILNCPSCGGDKNAQRGCSNYCGHSCSDYNKPPGGCPFFCMDNGCDCRPGFVYDNNVKACVKPKDCTPICKANEQYSSCVNGGCDARNCSQVGKPVPCVKLAPESCIKGCVCVAGYLRADNGNCVPKDQCPKQCGANERYVICSDTMCIPQNCSQRALSVPCPILGPKGTCPGKPKCICVENYLRDDDSGICIPSKKCTKSCGKNEYWEKCITYCSNQTCADIGKRINCPNIREGQCKSGCRCRPGFWRNASNVCVPENECPIPDCPEGEFWNRCPTVKCEGDYCPKNKDSPQTCPTGIVCDKPRCVCGVNRKRDRETGKCIPITQCPEFKCGRNEKYQACPVFCPGENCTDYINKSKCPPGRIGIVLICRPKCKCIKGYYRNADGACIPACECPRQSTSITTTMAPPTPASGGSNSSRGTGLTGILDGIAAFTGTCLYNRMKSGALENIIMSAFSVFTPIAELCLYSEGVAYDQCIKVLNLKDKQDIRNTFPALTSSYEGQTSVNFTTAAKVYSNEKNPLSDGFEKDVVDVFHAEAQDLDFSKNTEAANIINAWVESKTNNRIKNLISPDVLSALTQLVLVNAIYFKGEWLYQFNPKNTNEDNFYLNDGTTKKVKLMSQMRTFKYGEVSDLNCKVVEMFYKGENCSMVVVLPNSNNGIMDLAKNLQDPVNWYKVLGSLSSERVQLSVPPFEISTNTDLKDLLNAVNISNWFDPNNSGLKGITKKQEDVFVSAAIQKAFIKNDETGSEAAAANGFHGNIPPDPPPLPPKISKANHFLYYLIVQGITMFCGTFVR